MTGTGTVLDRAILNFSPELAQLIGLNGAIVLQRIHFWTNKQKNPKDGRYWVYNTFEQWHEQFPFWSIRTVKRTFSYLEEKRLLLTDNFNKRPFDRTKWYAVNYEQLAMLEANCKQIDSKCEAKQ